MKPKLTQPQEHPNEPLLEAQLVQARLIGEETNGLLEAILAQGDKNNPEPVLEASLAQSIKNTDRIVESLEPTQQAVSKMAQFLAEMKGERGDDGHTPTAEELVALITPLIPEPVPGKDGLTPTAEELVALITPLIPAPVPGPAGKDGKDGRPDTTLAAAVSKLKKQIDSLASSLTTSMVTYRVNGELVANGAVLDLVSGDNVTFETETTKDGARIVVSSTSSGGPGGGVTVETPTGTVDAVNQSFTVSATPKWIVSDGIIYFEGAGYSRASLNITMDVPPSQFIRAVI